MYAAVFVVSGVASGFLGFGMPALVATFVSCAVTVPLFGVIFAVLVCVGVGYVLVGDSIPLRVFCVIETVACVWVFSTFSSGMVATLGASALDLFSAPVEAEATYEAYNYDDEGPESVGVTMSVDGEDRYVTWAEDASDQLDDMGLGIGDHFRVWVYPHTGIPVSIVDPASYS